MQAVERFREVVDGRHQYARDWKERAGGKVLGYFCTYVPEELVYAAGILPVRILGSHEPQDITEPHIFGMYCPFCRDCLAQGLLGRYDYLDGTTLAHSCMHIRQTFDSWQRHVPVDYSYYIFMPNHVQSRHAQACFTGELSEFKKSLEGWLGAEIAEGAIDQAIEVYNHNRRLLMKVYETRKAEPPLISGSEAAEIVLASQLMDKAEHNRLLEQLLGELPGRRDRPQSGTRLLHLGSEHDDIQELRLFEALGANIVIDEHCTGSRYFWNEVVPSGDRLAAIAGRYVDRPPCPQKDLVERRRLKHILKLAQDYKVEGAILAQQKFCDPHAFDMPPIRNMLKEHNIPSLFLELDVTIPPGQFRTRIEAFLEMLNLGQLHEQPEHDRLKPA